MRVVNNRLVLVSCVLGVLCVPGLLGDETPTRQQTTPPFEVPGGVFGETSPQIVRELSQLRKEIGGSVLAGSVLEDETGNGEFEDGLRSVLGITSAKKLPRANSPIVRDKPMAIKTIRRQCKLLDEIANEIESLKHYDRADKLRRSAGKLRDVARYLDR